MAKSNITFDPILYLRFKNDAIMDRYKNFNQKISFYLTILSISFATLILIFKELINNVKIIFVYNNMTFDILIIHILLSSAITISTLGVLIFLFLLIKKILNALDPITLTEYDYEAIDLYLNNKKDKAIVTIVNDYKKMIQENTTKMNEKYSILFLIRRNFVLFLIFYFLLSIFIFIGVVYGK